MISRANGSISITHAVRNLSAVPGNAPASLTRLWLSLDGSTAGAIDLGTVSVPTLTGGGTATVTSVVRIPVGTPSGVYYVLAGADDPNAIAEVREDNNLGRSTTRLIVGPDVKAVAVTTVAAAARGMNVSAPVTLRNQGGAPAGPFTLAFALAPVSDPSGASDVAVGPGRSVGPLAAGVTVSVPGVIRVPPDAPAGVYRVRVSALGVTDDAYPRNDSLLSTGTLTVVLPDLVVSSVSAPAVAIAGRTITVANAVTNNAALAPAGAFHVGLYLADALLAERAVAGLGPMATSSTPFSVALPGTPGTFPLKVVADDQGEAAERVGHRHRAGHGAARRGHPRRAVHRLHEPGRARHRLAGGRARHRVADGTQLGGDPDARRPRLRRHGRRHDQRRHRQRGRHDRRGVRLPNVGRRDADRHRWGELRRHRDVERR